MKTFTNFAFCFLVLLLFRAPSSHAQIIVTAQDFGSVGDTLRTSLKVNLQGFNFATTGPNHVWNFSQLGYDAQRLDTIFSIKQVPTVFLLSFFTVANLAVRLDLQQVLPGIQATNAWQFFNKGLTNYRDWGYGLIVQNITLPLRFTTPDLLYSFPLVYNQTFSSNAYLEYPLPGVGYISIARNRQNHVDGWGSLTTPYGTFPTLRVKSKVVERDSIYIDSIGQGISIIRNYTEYKWLGKNQKIPLLVATVDSILGTFVVYKDSLRTQTVGLAQPIASSLNVYPQPFENTFHYHYCSNSSFPVRINLYDAEGRLLFTRFEQPPQGCSVQQFIWPEALNNRYGLFVLLISDGKENQTVKLIRARQ